MDVEVIKAASSKWRSKLPLLKKMYNYYKGKTDAIDTYKMQTDRSNLKVNCNFIKKFIKEEVSYSIGNDITYVSKSSNDSAIESIDLNFEELSEKHDSDLLKYTLIFSYCYEIYYLEDNVFKSKIIKPLDGFCITDSKERPIYFVHMFKENDEDFIDVYTNKSIEHLDSDFKVLKSTEHYFGFVPVGVCELSEEAEYDTIFNDIKGLQDAFETNLSDLTNEISDFRNAYMVFVGAQVDENDAKEMKEMGIIQIRDKNGDAKWLLKNLNDTFIQNTLSTLEDKMYQLSGHINHNEKMQSNLSGVALRSRLISLEEKCKLNQKSLVNCIKVRLKAFFIYINQTSGYLYDWRDIKIKLTPNIPQDDLIVAQMLSQLGDKISDETGIAQLSFVENPRAEIEKKNKENKEMNEGLSLLGGFNNE